MKKIKVLNVQFDVANSREILDRIWGIFDLKKHEPGRQIVTPNPEMLLKAQKDEHFMRVLNHSWMSVPDGTGILWATTYQKITKNNGDVMRMIKAFLSLCSLVIWPKFCRKIFIERITGTDLMQSICDEGRRHGVRVFLLGAAPQVAEKTKKKLEDKFPGINIVGATSGSPQAADRGEMIHLINQAKPDILFVAFGAPAQELWIHRVLTELSTVKIAMGVGGAFDFIAGVRKRAPKFIQKIGMEWLYRLLQEPSRIKRIWNATITFPYTVVKNS